MDGNTYAKLPLDVDPKYIYAYQVKGDCCWRIYNKTNFAGPSEDLENLDFQVFGFRGIPKYPQFNVNSVKKIPCPSSKWKKKQMWYILKSDNVVKMYYFSTKYLNDYSIS